VLKLYDKSKNKLKINLDIFSEKNEYFYYFKNEYNIYVYFYKKHNSNTHQIYFRGITEINDIKSILKILSYHFTFENIEDILHKRGKFYNINENKIDIVNKTNLLSIFDVFDILYDSIYKNDDIINLNINGYSLGGPISQVFIYILNDMYKDNSFNISLYNIESWFVLNEKKYNEFTKILKLTNVYNNRSILYLFNKLFQSYNKVDYFIENTNINDYKINKYIDNIFPIGIIKYIVNYHVLYKIIRNKE
jgi:hypothetical protein